MTRIKNIFKGIWGYIISTDIILWLIILAMSFYSLLLLKSISRTMSTDYARTQLMAIAIGMVGAIIVSLMDYELIANKWKIIAVVSVVLMLYTMMFGDTIKNSGGINATSWIKIGGRTFQTSELIKIAFLITFAKHLDEAVKADVLNRPTQLLLLLGHVGVVFLLCEWQGDTGAGIVFLFIALIMAFAAGVRIRYFLMLFAGGAVLLPVIWQFFLKEYQKNRVLSVFNLDDPNVQMFDGYQQYQGMLSIGSGQLSGTGLNEGSRVAARSVPFQQSDFIFTAAGEELGFIGCVVIVILLALLMIKLLHVASYSRDNLGRLICYGFFGLIFIQSVINIGMTLAIFPVVGITLPFFSSGGSSAMCLYLGIGLVQSVYSRRKEKDGFHLNNRTSLKVQYKKLNTRVKN